jgi:hypothetical protein
MAGRAWVTSGQTHRQEGVAGEETAMSARPGSDQLTFQPQQGLPDVRQLSTVTAGPVPLAPIVVWTRPRPDRRTSAPAPPAAAALAPR